MIFRVDKNSKIFVTGHRGMVGSALVDNLQRRGYKNIIVRTRHELDLLDQHAVKTYLKEERPEYIFIASAKVGGIQANNSFRADFIYQNLMIEANLIHGAHEANINNLCFLGSSCIYPRDCPQPIKEEYLLTGPLEQTNEPYAIAKIAGVKLCESYNRQYKRRYICVMPTNLYGPNDNYDLNNSHVLPALLRKTHEATQNNDPALTVWGTGSPKREFLYVDDLAEACVFLMETGYEGPLLNVGSGEEVTIRELAVTIKEIVGFNGQLLFDSTKPDGTPRKLLDSSNLRNLGWRPKISLYDGIGLSYTDFQKKYKKQN